MSTRDSVSNELMFFIAKYVAVALCVSRVKVKNPRNEPSLHCRSALSGSCTSSSEIWSANAGITPAPNGEVEVTRMSDQYRIVIAVCMRSLQLTSSLQYHI